MFFTRVVLRIVVLKGRGAGVFARRLYEKNISSYKYISFDIFDTLIRRIVYSPQQVYKLMNACDAMLPHEFENLRINAEIKAANENEFYDIYDIYKYIEFEGEGERNAAIELEVKTEIEVCEPNPEMFELYKKCIEENRYVILTSDMYLPRKYLVQILDACGIVGYNRLFISCEEKANKIRGTLFRKVLGILNAKPSEVFHIGDNIKSDFIQPRLNGIGSKLYSINHNSIYNDKKLVEDDYLNQQVFVDSMLNLKYANESSSVPFRIGYICLGPLLFGFSKWLERQLADNSIDKVFFLSRDGKIMMDAYEAIGGKKSFCYLYASRKALIIPTIWRHAELDNVINIFYKTNEDTVSDLLGKLGISVNENYETIKEYGLNLDDKIDYTMLMKSEFYDFYNNVKEKVIINSKNQEQFLIEYINEVGFTGKVAIVDIGWFGNMQKALTETLLDNKVKVDIRGFYLGIDPRSKTVEDNKLNVKGFLFEKGYEELRKYEKSINAIMEFIFSTTHGSILGYRKEDGCIKPNYAPYEYDNNENYVGEKQLIDESLALKEMQDAALNYIKDIMRYKRFASQTFSAKTSFANFIQFGINPQMKDLEYFGDLRLLGSGDIFNYFAKPSRDISLFKLMNEIKKSVWRMGYIKRLIPLPIPYSKIYFILRRLAGKLD